MAIKHPITVEGNLTDDPEVGQTDEGRDWARFRVAVNERRFNDETNEWEDTGTTIFHQVSVFGQQSRNVVASLKKGDNAIVDGDLHFRVFEDDEGRRRQSTQIVARSVGPSLRWTTAEVQRAPKSPSPDVAATGPIANPGVDTPDTTPTV